MADPRSVPIGTETPTNLPFSRVGPVSGTKLPRMIPTAMARKIHRARKRSSQPRDLKADTFLGWSFSAMTLLSMSRVLKVVVSSFGVLEVWPARLLKGAKSLWHGGETWRGSVLAIFSEGMVMAIFWTVEFIVECLL